MQIFFCGGDLMIFEVDMLWSKDHVHTYLYKAEIL